MSDRLAELTTGFLERHLTEAECRELLEAVEADPRTADDLAEQTDVHRALELLAEPPLAEQEREIDRILYYVRASTESDQFVRDVKTHVRERLGRKRSAGRRRRAGRRRPWSSAAARLATTLAIAATLAVAAGLLFAARRGEESQRGRASVPRGLRPIGEVVALSLGPTAEVEGPVVLRGPDERAEDSVASRSLLKLGSVVRLGDSIRTGGGKATVQYSGERTTVALEERTEVLFSEVNGAKRVGVQRGMVRADVAEQPAGSPMLFVTPHAEAAVLGTRLTLAVEERSTRLDVADGRVRLVRLSDRASIKVAGGQYSIAGEGVRLQAMSKAPPASEPVLSDRSTETLGLPSGSRVLFEEDFSPASQGMWRGDLEGAPDTAAGDLAMGSAPMLEGRRSPSFFGEVRSPRDEGGWPVSRHTYLRFRYFAQGFGRRQCLKLMLKRFDEMNYGGYLEGIVVGRWQMVTLRLDDSVVYINRPERRLSAGEKLYGLVWLGHTEGAAPVGARFWIDDVVLFESPHELPARALEP